ncbi:hypothetical protein Bbelb_419240 [Branchiostoma belcheri]|nr:hypothetical protein Bbelb_419240 [Branchiostoma belcheri]
MSGKLSIFLPFVALYVLGYTLEYVNGQDYSYMYADRMLQFYGRPLQWTWCVDDIGGQLSVTERNRLCGPDDGEIQGKAVFNLHEGPHIGPHRDSRSVNKGDSSTDPAPMCP